MNNIDLSVRNASMGYFPRQHAFAAARAHTRRVRFLKIFVPAVTVTSVAVFVFFAYFNPFRSADMTVDIGQISANSDRLIMEQPHLTGYNKRQQSYEVTARSASQQLSTPGMIDLSNLDAVISLIDKTSTTLTAESGRFDSNAEVMSIQQNVRVKSTKGYDAVMQSGTIDFKAGTVVSTEPVTVNLANGTIAGKGVNIVDGGGRIIFSGGVTAQFQTPHEPDADDASHDPSSTQDKPAQESPAL